MTTTSPALSISNQGQQNLIPDKDSPTKLSQRLRVSFFAHPLRSIATPNASRSGITLSAFRILLELRKICDVELFCEVEFYQICKRECAKVEELQGIRFVSGFGAFSTALSHLCALKYTLCNRTKTPLLLYFIKACFFPFMVLARHTKLNAKILHRLNTSHIIFSPYYAFPKEVLGLQATRFTLLHDVIPIVYEEYFRMSEIPIDKLLRQLLRQRHDFYDIADTLNPHDYYITNSAYTKADFLKFFPKALKEKHISVALLGAERNIFHRDYDEKKNQALRKLYNIPPNARYIFSLCSLDPRKNLLFVVENFIALLKYRQITDLVLVLGGGAWDSFKHILESKIASFGEYRRYIIQAGYVADEHLANLFTHSLCSIYLSTYEGFGLPVLESLSCGCPTIASSTTSIPEVLGDAGIALEPSDSKGLQEALWQLCNDEGLREKLNTKALERAEMFSWEKCTKEILQAFNAALGNDPIKTSLMQIHKES